MQNLGRLISKTNESQGVGEKHPRYYTSQRTRYEQD